MEPAPESAHLARIKGISTAEMLRSDPIAREEHVPADLSIRNDLCNNGAGRPLIILLIEPLDRRQIYRRASASKKIARSLGAVELLISLHALLDKFIL